MSSQDKNMAVPPEAAEEIMRAVRAIERSPLARTCAKDKHAGQAARGAYSLSKLCELTLKQREMAIAAKEQGEV